MYTHLKKHSRDPKKFDEASFVSRRAKAGMGEKEAK